MNNTSVKTRTEYSARNTVISMVSRVVAILMGYVARIVFTHTLSQDYVGINGLFIDIFHVLALSELGVSTAITYALYGPIARADVEKQKSLMGLYRRFYYLVSLIILVLGLAIMPFLHLIISVDLDMKLLYIIYALYLANSCLSYVMVYRKTLIDAHQLSYITVLIYTGMWTLQNILQIVILLTTHNFVLYLVAQIICTLLINFLCSYKATKMYPYLADKEIRPLDKSEKDDIFTSVKAMLVHKIGEVMVNNSDNILLSIIVGTLAVGSYSNYYLVVGSATQVLNQAFQGITASVGNLGQTADRLRVKKVFETSFFVDQWLFGLVAICMYQVLDVFVQLSFGAQYVFNNQITLVICLVFYLKGMRQACLAFRDSMGLFRYDWIKAIFEVIINIVASILLGRMLGTIGIFMGTIICTVLTSIWVEPFVLYKYRIKEKVRFYYLRFVIYAVVMIVALLASTVVSNIAVATLFNLSSTGAFWMNLDEIAGMSLLSKCLMMLVRLILSFVIVNTIFALAFFKTKEFSFAKEKLVYLYNARKG